MLMSSQLYDVCRTFHRVLKLFKSNISHPAWSSFWCFCTLYGGPTKTKSIFPLKDFLVPNSCLFVQLLRVTLRRNHQEADSLTYLLTKVLFCSNPNKQHVRPHERYFLLLYREYLHVSLFLVGSFPFTSFQHRFDIYFAVAAGDNILHTCFQLGVYGRIEQWS